MGNQGLPKLLNAGFTRIQPGLCGYCQFYRLLSDPRDGDLDVCSAKHKILVNPHAVRGRCNLFERAEVQPVPQETIDEWVKSAEDMQAMKARIKAR